MGVSPVAEPAHDKAGAMGVSPVAVWDCYVQEDVPPTGETPVGPVERPYEFC